MEYLPHWGSVLVWSSTQTTAQWCASSVFLITFKWNWVSQHMENVHLCETCIILQAVLTHHAPHLHHIYPVAQKTHSLLFLWHVKAKNELLCLHVLHLLFFFSPITSGLCIITALYWLCYLKLLVLVWSLLVYCLDHIIQYFLCASPYVPLRIFFCLFVFFFLKILGSVSCVSKALEQLKRLWSTLPWASSLNLSLYPPKAFRQRHCRFNDIITQRDLADLYHETKTKCSLYLSNIPNEHVNTGVAQKRTRTMSQVSKGEACVDFKCIKNILP